MEERIKARLDALRGEATAFKSQAEQRLAAYNGAIGELEALLKETPETAEQPARASGPAVPGGDP